MILCRSFPKINLRSNFIENLQTIIGSRIDMAGWMSHIFQCTGSSLKNRENGPDFQVWRLIIPIYSARSFSKGVTTDRPSWSEIWWLIFRLRETVRGIAADSSRLHNMVLSMHNCWHRQSAAHTPSRDTTDDRLILHCVILRRWSDGHSLPEAIKRSWNLLFKKVGTSHRHAWSLKYETISLGCGVGAF